MIPIPDLVVKEINPPKDLYCSSGHTAPEKFSREGPGTPALPIRFFHISGKGINGVYCEPCLIIANHMAYLKEKEKNNEP